MSKQQTVAAIDDAIKAAGSIVKLATALGVSDNAPAMWKKRESVPADHCAAIELKTGVKRWHLRPHDWHRIWPELVGSDGAPIVAKEPTRAAA